MLEQRTQSNVQRVDEADLEAERLLQVRILLDHLFKHEETTVKLILGYLYDVGSVNLINQKFQRRSLNRFMRMVAGMSKPIFKVIALRWFKKNCPQLITDWLQTQVTFAPAKIATTAAAIELAGVDAVAMPSSAPDGVIPDLETRNQEIRYLHRQVRLLTGMLVVTTVALSSVVVWISYQPRWASAQAQPLQPSPIEAVRERAESLYR
ncbi:MAG: hypothetical protein SFY66_27315 [Oculatellaceae cyanobacterium bins.114]|nr:hypothetical protein [Oculatellaceae cyanobacterium bins.114]